MLPGQIGGEFLSEAHSIAPVFVGSFLQLPSREAESQGGDCFLAGTFAPITRTDFRPIHLYQITCTDFRLVHSPRLLVLTFGWYIHTDYSF